MNSNSLVTNKKSLWSGLTHNSEFKVQLDAILPVHFMFSTDHLFTGIPQQF